MGAGIGRVGVLWAGVCGVLAAALVVVVALGAGWLSDRDGAGKRADKAAVASSYGKLPLRFEPNRGQGDREVRFLSRGAGYGLFLTPDEAVLSLSRPQGKGASARRQGAVLRMGLVGADPRATLVGQGRLAGTSNYLVGDRRQWRTGVPGFSRVTSRGVYPGIDMVFHGHQRELEYDFEIAPGADPRAIKLDLRGARRLSIDRQGDLLLHTPTGTVRQKRPVIYQQHGDKRTPVAGGYVLQGSHRVGFTLGAYDRSRKLIIDPVISYSSYLGGTGADAGNAIAVDGKGSAYVAGQTTSADFPTQNPYQQARAGTGTSHDAFVTKLTPDGSGLAYSTYLGGTSDDYGTGIALDRSGAAHLTGYTYSNNFPTNNGLQSALISGPDAFVSKLTADGVGLAYSTYLGGNSEDTGTGIAVDAAGDVHVTGGTYSTNFRTENALQSTAPSAQNGFVTKLRPDASGADSLVYSTYLGGSSYDNGQAIAVDANGDAYVTGYTASFNFPAKNAFRSTHQGSQDAFVTRLQPDYSGADSLIYSTFLGGSGFEYARGIAVDASGAAYVAGGTTSTNFPTKNAFQTALTGSYSYDAFVTRLDPDGSDIGYSTYLGAPGNDDAVAVAVRSGEAYVTGQTEASAGFPSKDAVQAEKGGGNTDAYVTRINTAAAGTDAVVFSSYLGGDGNDYGRGIAVDGAGNAYVTGQTGSADFPIRTPAFQGEFRAGDAFVTKIDSAAVHEPVVSGISPRSGGTGGGTKVVITGHGLSGATSVRFGEVPAESYTVDSDQQITAVSPVHPRGVASVSVANERGTSAAVRGGATSRFTYEGSWTKTGPPAGAALTGPAARLTNRKVLVVGHQYNLTAEAQLYDPATNSWSRTGDMKTARASHTVTALPDGRALVVGGWGANGSPIASVEFFDPNATDSTGRKGTFTAAAVGLGVPRSNHSATLINGPATICGAMCGKVLVVAGHNQSTQQVGSNTAEVYDPIAGVSEPTGNLLTTYTDQRAIQLARDPFDSPRCGVNCGKVLVYGGLKLAAAGNADPELYNPLTNNWTRTLGAPPLQARYPSLTLLSSGKVLSAGGHPMSINNGWTREAELYNPSSLNYASDPTWRKTLGSMSDARAGHAGVRLPSGKVLVVGPGGTYGARPEIYDPELETWRVDSAERRPGVTATLLSGGASADPDEFKVDPAVCAQWCGRVLVTGGSQPELYIPPPTLSAISADGGPANGGTQVTLTGRGFSNGTRMVRFGEASVRCPSESCRVDSDDKITATSPPHAEGPVEVTVVNEGGLSEGPAVRFRYAPAVPGDDPGPGPAPAGPAPAGPGPGLNVGPPGGFDAIAAALASEARRAADFSGCQAAVERQARRVRGGGRRAARQRAKTKATGRQRCLKLYGRTPGPVTGVAARSISQNTIELSFLAAGSDGSRAPAARNYLIKQSPRPIRTARDFGRAQTLCRGSCRFFITKVGGKITLSVNDLRPRRSYYYAIAARDNVSGRLGPRSQTVGSRTP